MDTSTGLPAWGRGDIVSVLNWNVLEAIQRFCEGPASGEEYCSNISPSTSLPLGDSFHRATYSMLLNEYQGTFELAGRVRAQSLRTVRNCFEVSQLRTLGSHPTLCVPKRTFIAQVVARVRQVARDWGESLCSVSLWLPPDRRSHVRFRASRAVSCTVGGLQAQHRVRLLRVGQFHTCPGHRATRAVAARGHGQRHPPQCRAPPDPRQLQRMGGLARQLTTGASLPPLSLLVPAGNVAFLARFIERSLNVKSMLRFLGVNCSVHTHACTLHDHGRMEWVLGYACSLLMYVHVLVVC